MMKPSTFGFLVVRGVRNLGKHWAMTIACIASLSVCMTLNTFATLAEVNVDSMVNYLGQQNEMVVYVDPEADDATIQSVGERITATPGVSRVQYMSKEDVLNPVSYTHLAPGCHRRACAGPGPCTGAVAGAFRGGSDSNYHRSLTAFHLIFKKTSHFAGKIFTRTTQNSAFWA